MAKSPKTVEGLRTALRELMPAQLDTHSITLHVFFEDRNGANFQRNYVSYHANIEVQYGETSFEVKATAPTPAKLISETKRELRIAAMRAQQTRELTHAAPRLAH